MKGMLVILNLAAAGAVIWAGFLLGAIHRVHSYSVYVELEKSGSLVKSPPLDVAERLKTIGGLDQNIHIVTFPAAALFALNALALAAVWKKKAASAPSR